MLKKIAFGGVGLVLLATPLLTSALTVQEQIAALLTQLNQLQQQIATLSASISNTSGIKATQVPQPRHLSLLILIFIYFSFDY